ncbi:trace amine-associated receptor 4-like [Gigantopelta aegis]|uniref:trace amine-associated receptor 4-like n=1 Tax=Gigantopelta aegis TaxID=1735272 RepID=UPI001B88808F|nr:trace amine-associated receptor 4-like [Gigantopelta aegis]
MTTNSTGFSSPKENSATINILLMSLTIILIFVSAGGNALTVAAVSRFKNLRYPSNIMIAALAISDFTVASLFTTINLLRTHMPFLFTVRPSCLVILFITQIVSLTSVVFQAVLSLERFYAIQFPYYYHAHATTAIHAIWSASIAAVIVVLSLPVLFGIDHWSEEVVCYSQVLFPSSYAGIIAAIVITFQMLGLLAFMRVLFAEIKFRCRDRNLQTSEMEKQSLVAVHPDGPGIRVSQALGHSQKHDKEYGDSKCVKAKHLYLNPWRKAKEDRLLEMLATSLWPLCSRPSICYILGLLAFLRVLFTEIKFRCRDRNLQTSEMEKQASLQSTLMILAFGISLCFYMPHIVCYFLGTFSNYSHNHLIMEIVWLMDVCNTAVNSFIYGLKNRKLRKAYKCCLRCKMTDVEPLTE